jgi:hypothetical protein
MTMDNDVNFDKDIDIDINFDLKSDVDIKLDKDVNIDVDVHSNADIYGNTATATFSAEAVGNNTLAEADVHYWPPTVCRVSTVC